MSNLKPSRFTKREYSLMNTRMYSRFVNRDGFKFDIYRNTLLTGLGHLLGMQDIIIGDLAFDAEFVVKANKPEQAKALLSDPKLRELLLAQPNVSLRNRFDAERLGGGFERNADELHFEVVRDISDVDLLKALFDIFAETLRQLVRI